ncbi:hypothetical protein DPMN_184376 [Dreissena polymorpha]|uniref:Uncharacterized protein n=1 Tax=Dreissena polymorpha TaxID=45954 RepID=A0A9D4I4I5_DREPO|nr:hypothetical protein DPMN_184376 [Dreissena polymorpha]
MITIVKAGEIAQRQPTPKTSILILGASEWSMKIDLDNKLVLPSIVLTNIGPLCCGQRQSNDLS